MTSLEERLRETFDGITLPSEVKESTLAFLHEEQIKAQAEQQSKQAERVVDIARPQHLQADARRAPDSPSQRDEASITASRKTKSFPRRMAWALAACLILGVFGFGGFQAYATETAIVGIEVNPSIELGVNRFDIVVDARALNDDGQKVLDEIAIIGHPYEEALLTIAGNETFLVYVGSDSYVDVNVACDDESQVSKLIRQTDAGMASLPCEHSCHQVSADLQEEAAAAGMGVSRYQAAQELLELDDSLTIEDCHSMSMRELRDRIAALDPASEYASTSEHGHGTGQGQGSGMHGRQGQRGPNHS